MNLNKQSIFRYKNKNVSEKVFKQRKKQSEVCKKLNEIKKWKQEREKEIIKPQIPTSKVIEGDRIVDFQYLAESLCCLSCKEVLSLSCIENEKRCGLVSLFTIWCHHCLQTRDVSTSNYNSACYKENCHRKIYDINARSVLGVINAGIGLTNINKFATCLNMPCMDNKMFKRHERIVGPAIESVSKASCYEAVQAERRATIENIDSLLNMLPQHLGKEFFIPQIDKKRSGEEKFQINDKSLVRLIVSFDTAWSQRGNGKSYNSLNGFSVIIGYFTGRILDYATRNRQCRMCDNGHDPSDHDCRLNYSGSAKSMEADLAKQLIINSDILKSLNTNGGVMVGDEDSSAIAAVRQSTDQLIVKLSDINHVTKEVSNKLYGLQKNHKELNTTTIKYLTKCFSYAVTQNSGNSEKVANAIRSIPLHTFNDHSTCGEWCGFVRDKENYEHSTVPGGLNDEGLLNNLKTLFECLANSSEKFSYASSSQANESFNASRAATCPKSKCFSLSESADFRMAVSVSKKNCGEQYISHVVNSLNLSPTASHTKKYLDNLKEKADKRSERIKTREFKLRRNILKKKKKNLQHNQGTATSVYKSNIGLLKNDVIVSAKSKETKIAIDCFNNEIHPPFFIFFDLETTGLGTMDEIVQIGLQYEDQSFGVYIRPTKPIPDYVSAVNGLTYSKGVMRRLNVPVTCFPPEEALQKLKNFLVSIAKLIIHDSISSNQLLRALITFDKCLSKMKISDASASIKKILTPTFQGILSTGMIQRLADEGISHEILIDTFLEKGDFGIELLFLEIINGKPRITKQKRIIYDVTEFIKYLIYDEPKL